jgi:hypothetical protein
MAILKGNKVTFDSSQREDFLRHTQEDSAKVREYRDEVLSRADHIGTVEASGNYITRVRYDDGYCLTIVSAWLLDLGPAGHEKLEPKLKPGDKFDVSGWVRLKGVDGGKRYIVTKRDDYSYTFRLLYGRRPIRHYIRDIDSWLEAKSDINYITKVED